MSSRVDAAPDVVGAYRATAYFLREVHRRGDAGLEEPEVARRVATIGYDARGAAHIAEQARLGVILPRGWDEPAQRLRAIEDGVSLPGHALRHLVHHSSVHLRVEWRDLPTDRWTWPAVADDGEEIVVADLVRRREIEVWAAALAIQQHDGRSAVPPELLDEVLEHRDATG